jgi:hypothetical protein
MTDRLIKEITPVGNLNPNIVDVDDSNTNGNLNIWKNLTVRQNATINLNLTVKQDATVERDLTVNRNLQVDKHIINSHSNDNAVINLDTGISFVNYDDLDRLFYNKIEGEGWKNQPVKCVDGDNNLYVCGSYDLNEEGDLRFYNPTDLNNSVRSLYYNGNSNVFLTKYNHVGDNQWATRIGGNYDKYDPHVSCDQSGNVFLTTETNDDNESKSLEIYDVNNNVEPVKTLQGANNSNCILVKYNTNGLFGWNLRFVGDNSSVADIRSCTDLSGNVFVCGKFSSVNMNIYDSSSDTDSVKTMSREVDSGSTVLFLAKFTPEGRFLWSLRLDAKPDSEDEPYIACDASGNVYYCGDYEDDPLYIYDTKNNVTPHKVLANDTNDDCAFIAKFNKDGHYLWATRLGQGESFNVKCVVDHSGNVYFAGTYNDDTLEIYDTSNDSSSPVAVIPAPEEYNDLFIIKYNSDGVYQWRNRIGNFSTDYSSEVSICVDKENSLYLANNFYQRNLDFYNPSNLESSVYTLNYVDDEDIFLCKYNSNGIFQWATFCGGYSDEYDADIVADNEGHVYLSGVFGSDPLYIYDVKHNTVSEGSEVATMSTSDGYDGVFILKYNKFGILNNYRNVYLADNQDVPTGVRKEVVMVRESPASLYEGIPNGLYFNLVNDFEDTTNPTIRAVFGIFNGVSLIMYNGFWQVTNYVVFPNEIPL